MHSSFKVSTQSYSSTHFIYFGSEVRGILQSETQAFGQVSAPLVREQGRQVILVFIDDLEVVLGETSTQNPQLYRNLKLLAEWPQTLFKLARVSFSLFVT